MSDQKRSFSVAGYAREVSRELKQVSWPSRNDTWRMTTLVLLTSTIVALYLGGLDYIFTQILKAWL